MVGLPPAAKTLSTLVEYLPLGVRMLERGSCSSSSSEIMYFSGPRKPMASNTKSALYSWGDDEVYSTCITCILLKVALSMYFYIYTATLLQKILLYISSIFKVLFTFHRMLLCPPVCHRIYLMCHKNKQKS